MSRVKVCSMAIACLVSIIGMSPISTFAAETDSESVTLTETDEIQQDKKEEQKDIFRDKKKEAREKWDTLSEKQKDEVYQLLEKNMKIQYEIMDKLVDLGVLHKEDVTVMKANMAERLERAKEKGEFPLFKEKKRKSN